MPVLPAAGCQSWSELLVPAQVPVLRATQDAIDQFRDDSDRADAHLLADIVLRDPLMCLRVLMNASHKLRNRLATPVETVTAALVLTGIEPFFRDFAALPVVQDRLAHEPAALAGAMAAFERAHRAARLAAAFAIHRQDDDVEVLHQAALLHDFPSLLVWCEAPALALEMALRQRHDATLRSADVQRAVLGVTVDMLGQRLMERWELPASLRELAHPDDGAGRARPRTVRLAVQIARHLDTGWHNAALPDDFVELGSLLNLPPHSAAHMVRQAL